MICKACDEKNPPGTYNCLHCQEPLPPEKDAGVERRALGGMVILGLFGVALAALGLWGWQEWTESRARSQALAQGKTEYLVHRVCLHQENAIRDNELRAQGYVYTRAQSEARGVVSGAEKPRHCYQKELGKAGQAEEPPRGGELVRVYR
ncbi:hypothetical protein DL240_18770 [Lujinxingia litoralis]|uniref:Uncharacterized protein n=1 Tax=Lujinxingia litoralis TaxID=2211119 RepID=A0A328C0I1_9DELT|nr:hypothetical protein [Lujinxingia litoralis]RAL20076.1 hypothetical protein DL240_18770 [Lujinxingia litoralis]